MIFKTRAEHIEKVINEIGNSSLYEYPHIDFILVKEINERIIMQLVFRSNQSR